MLPSVLLLLSRRHNGPWLSPPCLLFPSVRRWLELTTEIIVLRGNPVIEVRARNPTNWSLGRDKSYVSEPGFEQRNSTFQLFDGVVRTFVGQRPFRKTDPNLTFELGCGPPLRAGPHSNSKVQLGYVWLLNGLFESDQMNFSYPNTMRTPNWGKS
jgi:hypothetical protein